MYKNISACAAFLGILTIPLTTFAHEVYVLSGNAVATDLSVEPFDMVAVAMQNMQQFLFWGFIATILIVTVFSVSIIRPIERKMSRFLHRIKSFAPAISRITVGLGFIAISYYGAMFGPELPLAGTFGQFDHFVALLFAVLGTLLIIGFWARAAAVIALALFAFAVYQNGSYMLTYTNYLGEIIVLLLIGSHRISVHSFTGWEEKFHRYFHFVTDKIQHLAFPILRVSFGISLLYASIYAKVLHNNLALQVASLPLAGHEYGLAHYFGFEPHFLVLGAAIVEILLGLFFILGIEIRFTSIFLLFWLSLSLLYFGETVWPHIILIGIPIAFIFHGYDKYSLEGLFFKNSRREPVL